MKRNDKGLTLIEVLVAVMVLGIVIVPMLHSFVSAYNVNAKSREIMRATTLAQNEMEIFEREKLEVLAEDAKKDDDAKKYGYDVDDSKSDTTTDPVTGEETKHVIYTFTKEGVTNDGSGKEMFDVVVKLDPQSASASDLYYKQNTQGLLSMNTLSSLDSGIYVQKIGDDEEVYNIYYGRQDTLTYDADYFARDLKRTITVKIEQDSSDTTVVKVNYRYQCGYGLMTDNDKRNYSTGDQVVFNNAQTPDEGENPIELKSVYLFYIPRYGIDYPALDENIVIENKQNLPVDVYIVRQNIEDGSGLVTEVPYNYHVNIDIYEGLNGEKTNGAYFTNLNLNQAGGVGTTSVTLRDPENSREICSGKDAIERLSFRSLDARESKDRIYTMDVSVYRHEEGGNTGDPLVRLTGTKIE